MGTLYRHPSFAEKAESWRRYKDLYEGKHKVVCVKSEYLWPHLQEEMKDPNGYANIIRKSRERRTRYLKLPEIIVSLLTSFFFREEPVVDEIARKLLDDDGAIENIDGLGTSLSGFIKDYILKNYLIYGRPMVLVDSFNMDIKSEGQRKEAGQRPFWEMLDPLAVVDWEIESRDPTRIGSFNFLRYEYDIVLPRTATSRPVSMRYSDTLAMEDGRYIIIRDSIKTDDKGLTIRAKDGSEEWERVAVITTGLEKIPVSYIDCESWIDGVCEETLRFHNLRSSKDNVEYHQAYQKIFVAGVQTQEQIKALSENIVAILPSGATWGSIEPVDTAGLERSINQALDNVFKVGLNLGRTLPADSRAAQSEGAQSEEKTSMYSLIESSIDDIETLANQALSDYALFRGKKDFEGRITLNREIREEDFNQFLTTWQAFADALKGSPTVNKAAIRKVIKKLNLPISEEDLETAIDEAAMSVERPAPQPGGLIGNLFNAQ